MNFEEEATIRQVSQDFLIALHKLDIITIKELFGIDIPLINGHFQRDTSELRL